MPMTLRVPAARGGRRELRRPALHNLKERLTEEEWLTVTTCQQRMLTAVQNFMKYKKLHKDKVVSADFPTGDYTEVLRHLLEKMDSIQADQAGIITMLREQDAAEAATELPPPSPPPPESDSEPEPEPERELQLRVVLEPLRPEQLEPAQQPPQLRGRHMTRKHARKRSASPEEEEPLAVCDPGPEPPEPDDFRLNIPRDPDPEKHAKNCHMAALGLVQTEYAQQLRSRVRHKPRRQAFDMSWDDFIYTAWRKRRVFPSSAPAAKRPRVDGRTRRGRARRARALAVGGSAHTSRAASPATEPTSNDSPATEPTASRPASPATAPASRATTPVTEVTSPGSQPASRAATPAREVTTPSPSPAVEVGSPGSRPASRVASPSVAAPSPADSDSADPTSLVPASSPADPAAGRFEGPRLRRCHRCAGVGQLLVCDTCPRVFHARCVPAPPRADQARWSCPVCGPLHWRAENEGAEGAEEEGAEGATEEEEEGDRRPDWMGAIVKVETVDLDDTDEEELKTVKQEVKREEGAEEKPTEGVGVKSEPSPPQAAPDGDGEDLGLTIVSVSTEIAVQDCGVTPAEAAACEEAGGPGPVMEVLGDPMGEDNKDSLFATASGAGVELRPTVDALSDSQAVGPVHGTIDQSELQPVGLGSDPAATGQGVKSDPALPGQGLGLDPAPSEEGLGLDPAVPGQGLESDPSPSGHDPGSDPSPSREALGSDPAQSGQDPASDPAPSGQDPGSDPSPSGHDPGSDPSQSGHDPGSDPAPSGHDPGSDPAPPRDREAQGSDPAQCPAAEQDPTPAAMDTGEGADQPDSGAELPSSVGTGDAPAVPTDPVPTAEPAAGGGLGEPLDNDAQWLMTDELLDMFD